MCIRSRLLYHTICRRYLINSSNCVKNEKVYCMCANVNFNGQTWLLTSRNPAVCALVHVATRSVPTSILQVLLQPAGCPKCSTYGYILLDLVFRCPLDHAKRSFYRVANSIFSKIGRIASEEIVLQLVKSKCSIIRLGSTCELTKAQIASLDFAINRCFMKLFSTNNIEIVKSCQEFVCFDVSSVQLSKRVEKFVTRFHNDTDQYCSCI